MSFDFIAVNIAPVFYKLLYLSATALLLGVFFALLRKPLDKIISPRWKDAFWIIMIAALIFRIRIKSPISISDALNLRRLEIISFYGTSQTVKSAVFDYAVPIIWIAGCLLSAVILIIGRLKLNKAVKKALKRPEDKALKDIVNECCDMLGLSSSTVRTAVQDYVKTPAVTGFFTPIILLPEYYTQLSRPCLKYMILHELSHFKRRDTRFNIIISVIKTVYWFNPLIYPLFKMVREDMELANDSCVLAKLNSDECTEYRNAVFENLRFYVKSSNTANLLCMTDTAYSIKRRIKMLDSKGFFEKRSFLITALCTVIAAAGIMLFVSSTGLETEVTVELEKTSDTTLYITFTNSTFSEVKTTGIAAMEKSICNSETKRQEWQELTFPYYYGENVTLSCPEGSYKYGQGFTMFLYTDWLQKGDYRIKIAYKKDGVTEYAVGEFNYDFEFNADSITKSDVFSAPDDGADAYLKGEIDCIYRYNRSGNEYKFTDYYTLDNFVYEMKAADWHEGSGCLDDNCRMHKTPLFEVEIKGDNPVKFSFYQICDRTADVKVTVNNTTYEYFTDEKNALKIKSFSEKKYELHFSGTKELPEEAIAKKAADMLCEDLSSSEQKALAENLREFHKYLEYELLCGIEADLKEPERICWDWLINGVPDEYFGERAWVYDEYGSLYQPTKPTLTLKLDAFEADIAVIKNKAVIAKLSEAITLLKEGIAAHNIEKLFAAHEIIHDYDYFAANYPVSSRDDLWVAGSGLSVYFGHLVN